MIDYNKLFKWWQYIFFIFSALTLSTLLYVTYPTQTNLNPLNPPQWLFAPMWAGLFLLIGLSLKRLREQKKKNQELSIAYWLFLTQLMINFAWGLIYGITRSSLLGAISLVFAWFFVLATIIEVRALDKKAGYLMLPYLCWMTAAVLVSITSAFY